MNTFLISWALSALTLIALAGWLGTQTEHGVLGILIDGRGRYSLTHFQTVLWTIVILSSAIGVLVKNGFSPEGFGLTPQLLGLMGISAGSAVLATGVKASKDAPGSPARIARAGKFSLSDGTNSDEIAPRFAQIWLEEEGDQADKIVSIAKYQNFIFTLVVFGVYVTMACESGGLPELPENMVALIGISHAGYVGGKMPGKK